MTFSFRRPTDDAVRSLIDRQAGQPWSYDWPAITRGEPAPHSGWQIDRHRVLLGHGAETFDAACRALCAWRMFPREMCEVHWPKTPDPLELPQAGEVVAVLYRSHVFRLWMLFPARVVYQIEGDRRFGFAYGTLPDHPERGEERFLALWNHADDSVWYELLAFSRPGHWLARLGYPYARYEQAKFRRLSGLAMQEAVSGPARPSLA